jgi:hypothetical protein
MEITRMHIELLKTAANVSSLMQDDLAFNLIAEKLFRETKEPDELSKEWEERVKNAHRKFLPLETIDGYCSNPADKTYGKACHKSMCEHWISKKAYAAKNN